MARRGICGRIGSLDPRSILTTLINSAMEIVSQAQAGTVAMWDERSNRLIVQAAAKFGFHGVVCQSSKASSAPFSGYRNWRTTPGGT